MTLILCLNGRDVALQRRHSVAQLLHIILDTNASSLSCAGIPIVDFRLPEHLELCPSVICFGFLVPSFFSLCGISTAHIDEILDCFVCHLLGSAWVLQEHCVDLCILQSHEMRCNFHVFCKGLVKFFGACLQVPMVVMLLGTRVFQMLHQIFWCL